MICSHFQIMKEELVDKMDLLTVLIQILSLNFSIILIRFCHIIIILQLT